MIGATFRLLRPLQKTLATVGGVSLGQVRLPAL